MKFKLRGGERVDLLDRHELGQELTKAVEAVFDRLAQVRKLREARWVKPTGNDVTDANGAATVDVYRVPNGMEFRPRRVVLTIDGYDASSPYAAGGIQLLREGTVVSFEGGPLPALISIAEGSEPRCRNGDRVQVQVIGAPADTNVYALVEGPLHIGAP